MTLNPAFFLVPLTLAMASCSLNDVEASSEMVNAMASPRNQVVFLGDSITFGQGSSDPSNKSRPALLKESGEFDSDVSNLGFNGITAAGLASQDPLQDQFRPQAANVVVFFAGSNDIAQGASADAVYDTIKDYALLLRKRGWRVAVGTILGRNFPADQEVQRTTLNRKILLGELQRSGIAVIDYAKAQNAGRIPLSDGIHPSDVGYEAMDALETPVVQRLLGGKR